MVQGHWEPNYSPLEEQGALITTEPSLQSQSQAFICDILNLSTLVLSFTSALYLCYVPKVHTVLSLFKHTSISSVNSAIRLFKSVYLNDKYYFYGFISISYLSLTVHGFHT